MSEHQAPARRPQPPQQAQQPPRARTELSREELRAHLANVESQVKSALRIIASESKGMQQAHSALRADLSSALVRLQADMNGSASELAAKLDRLGAEVSFLSRQRRVSRIIFATFGMTLSFVLGVLVIAGWLLVKEGMLQNLAPPLPLEDMLQRQPSASGAKSPPPASLNERPPRTGPQPTAPNTVTGSSPLPNPVERQPLAPPAQGGTGTSTLPAAPSQESEQLPPNLLLQEQPRQ